MLLQRSTLVFMKRAGALPPAARSLQLHSPPGSRAQWDDVPPDGLGAWVPGPAVWTAAEGPHRDTLQGRGTLNKWTAYVTTGLRNAHLINGTV